MPLTPASPDSTARLLLHYRSGGNDHVLMVRYFTSGAAAAAASVWRSVFAAQNDHFDTSTVFEGAGVIEPSSNVENPVSFTPLTCVGTALPAFLAARYIGISGRSSDGRKVRYKLFGFVLVGTTPGSYRLSPEDDANVDSFRADFDSALEETDAITVGGITPVLRQYTNVGISGYWQREARS